MTIFLLTIIATLLIVAYLRQVVKQVDIVPISGDMLHGPTVHVEKRLYQVLWDEWGRSLWWFVWGVVVGWMARGVVW